jgi:hypothetical protein
MSSGADRLMVPTCIGCAAMSRLGDCDGGCREQRLDLIRASAFDELVTLAVESRAAADAFAAVVERLAGEEPGNGGEPGNGEEPGDDGYEAAYRAVQADGRAALERHPGGASRRDELLATASEPAMTWWCPTCGGVDAPQECLGICVWRAIEWVAEQDYALMREQAAAEHAHETALRALVRQFASVTPRTGQWERSWSAFRARAIAAIDRVGPDTMS